jgi:hypothetical protein
MLRRTGRLTIAGVAVLATAGVAQAQDYQVRIDHAAARVIVIPEPRGNVSVTVQHGPSRLPQLIVRQVDGRVVIDGQLGGGPFGHHDRTHCISHWRDSDILQQRHPGEGQMVGVEGIGRIAYADLPVITIHAPMDVRIAAGQAVYGEVGPTRSLDVSLAGCGDWATADVSGRMTADLAGSGDLKGGSSGSLAVSLAGSGDIGLSRVSGPADIDLAGSGDVAVGAVGQGLHVRLSGSGDVSAERVDGPIKASVAASGDVVIRDGRASQVGVSVAGSGDFRFGGTADALSATVAGSGDVHVARVNGPVSKSVVGSGEVTVGRSDD